MFRKPYKIKTSTTMKGSDRRSLKSLVETRFPALSETCINSLISSKNEMNQVKAMTHSGRTLMIYYSNSTPVFFMLDDMLYPTIYTVWKHTNLLPTIVTVPPVLEKICNGADLMAPGVITDESSLEEMKDLKINDICAVRISGNMAPIAVGMAIISASDMCVDGVKGKAVAIMHNYKDNLWASGNSEDLPFIEEARLEEISNEIENLSLNEIEPNCLESIDQVSEDKNVSESECIVVNKDPSPSNEVVENNKNSVPNYTMDDILYSSFMTAIKVYGKKIQLPLLTSTFYSTYVLKSCPTELSLDIKKTSYKKLSVFLKKMVKDKVIQVKELTKGVESIVSINLESDEVKFFKLDPLFKSHSMSNKAEKAKEVDTSMNIQENYKFPSVVELFVVSAQVRALFETASIKKGDSVPSTVIREIIKSYVKSQNLQSERNSKEIILDPLLADCVLKKGENTSTMTWEEIHEAVVRNMPHAFQITFDGKEPAVKKGKLEPIKITVDIRTGNKKVTLIQNLETYGINPEKIAHHVQVAVAASTSITPNPGGKGTLVLIQGNQVLYLQKLFLDILKVPRKYIQGLENVPKKK